MTSSGWAPLGLCLALSMAGAQAQTQALPAPGVQGAPAAAPAAAAAATLSAADAAAQAAARPRRPVRVILVGDSTMATRSGYGDALCERFDAAQVDCVNLARGGRSSYSYRAEGRWEEVQLLLRRGVAERTTTYVLVQFGHNDQPGKPGRSTDLASDFPVNMARYAREVTAGGGVPVLVTPLTRRSFDPATQQLKNDLRPWSYVTLAMAYHEHAAALDLNAASAATVQAMGQAEADTLAMAPPPPAVPASAPATLAGTEPQGAAKNVFDRTHVGAKGAALFAHLVADLLRQNVPALAAHLRPGA